MPECLLVIASDAAWLEAAKLLLEEPDDGLPGTRVIDCANEAAALQALAANDGNQVSASVIYGFHRSATLSASDSPTGLGAREAAIELRAARRDLPIVFASPIRIDLLERYAAGVDRMEVVRAESIEAIRAALARMVRGPTGPQPWAQVDMFIGVESVKVRVSLADGQVLADMPVASDMRPFLEDAHSEFGPTWELYKYGATGTSPRLNDGWPDRLRLVGERLHQFLVSDPQRKAIEACLQRVGAMDNIHFRFITDHGSFPDVPFEAMRDRARDKFVRDMSPLARRILLRPTESVVSANGAGAATTLSTTARLTGRMLLIQSDTGSGALRVGHHRFKGQEARSFSRLPDLAAEIEGIKQMRLDARLDAPEVCLLRIAEDNADTLEKALAVGPWDIVQYCGHSVRSDDGEVFLVIPGKEAGRLGGFSMGRFARAAREAGTGLLILSSCEGASSHGVFRAAQEGVPATIGFRWEVLSSDATKFSRRLHEDLAASKPLGRAYFDALRVLTPDSPAFLSAMLVVQHEAWAQ
jgi:hypothetical protein